MADPVRVAQITGYMNGGGVEFVVMNYYYNIDRERLQFDFVVCKGSTMVPRDETEALGGRESSAMQKIECIVDDGSYDRVLAPKRVVGRKRQGEWVNEEELLFPGYVFVDTDSPQRFPAELFKVLAMTKLLVGGDAENRVFIPISDYGKASICAFTGEEDCAMGDERGCYRG